jgi:D-tyrosyl-tRNA(Tyr) deacylase
MRVLIQRVKSASVEIEEKIKSSIGVGLLVFVGIEEADNEEDVEWLCGKITKLRIFGDENGLMNLSIQEVSGQFLVISQFTLHAMTKKGNRPSYIKAARPEQAIPLYEKFLSQLERESGLKVFSGEFGADMKVSLTNDGPVTIFIDSKNRE